MRKTLWTVMFMSLIVLAFVQAEVREPLDRALLPADLALAPGVVPMDYVPGELFVRVSSDSKIDDLTKDYQFMARDSGRGPLRVSDGTFFVKLGVPKNTDIQKFAEQLNERDGIIIAHPNRIFKLTSMPDDPLFDEQWAQLNTGIYPEGFNPVPDADVDAPEAWSFARGAGVTIAVLDTGVLFTHPDLQGQFWVNPGEDDGDGIPEFFPVAQGGDLNDIDDDGNCGNLWFATTTCVDDLLGYDLVYYDAGCAVGEDCADPDNNLSDLAGHGTPVTGVVAAKVDNGVGVSGACPDCDIMAVRICFKTPSGPGGCTEDMIYDGIEYAIANGADIISMSFGGTGIGPGTLVELAVQDAASAGVTMVAGAGNEGNEVMNYPAAFDDVIAVAGSDFQDKRPSASSYGTWIDIAAPSSQILSTDYSGSYAIFGGTSLAAPFVAAAAGLILSENPSLTPEQVKDIIQQGADPMPNEPTWIQGKLGAGRLNLYKSVCLVTDCRPDFAVTDLLVTPGFSGQNSPVRFTITNTHPYNYDVSYRIDTGSPDADVTGTVTVPGESSISVLRNVVYASVGQYTLTASADFDASWNETNEGNNAALSPVKVVAQRTLPGKPKDKVRQG